MKLVEFASDYARERGAKGLFLDVIALGEAALASKVIYEGIKSKQPREKEET